MSIAEAAFLASTLKNSIVSENKIRRLVKRGDLYGEYKQGRWVIDEDSVRSYFS